MLTHLSIQNFALINTLELDFSAGLVIFTGETGAGKSIIMDALSLALGKRSDTSLIREGCDKCEISSLFDISHNHAAQQWLTANELTAEGECILRRIITRDGRSKSYINGTPVPLQSLRELGLTLITLHGQHEHQNLLLTEGQRQLLDNFGQLNKLRAEVKTCFYSYRDLQKQLEEKKTHYQQLLTQKEFLNFQANELTTLALKEGELENLEKEQKRLAHGTQLIEGVQAVLYSLDENDSAISSTLRSLITKLTHLAHYDDNLHAINKLLDSAAIQIKEAISELQHFTNKIDIHPERLTEIDERLNHIYTIARKHHVDPQALLALAHEFYEKLASIETDEREIVELEKKLEIAANVYHEKAKVLSQKRQAAAKKLNQLITQYMQKLGMEGGSFTVNLQAENTLSANGYDKIEFLVATNPGSSQQPLTKIASGGELSRISLAITVVTVGQETKMTLIFDEIDAGIGGATASCVGELLKKLSYIHQILCITHAPQIATFSEQHFAVTKKIQKNTTTVFIQALTKEQKINEIARMIGGTIITPSTLAHAKEMLEL